MMIKLITISPNNRKKIRIALLVAVFVAALILVLVEKSSLEAEEVGKFQSTVCQLPMELEGLNGDFDNPVADLAGISPAGIRFNLSIKNDVSGTLTVWDKDKPLEKSSAQGTMDIIFGNDPGTTSISYGSEKPITNNFLGFKAEYLQQQVIGKSFRCHFKRLSDGNNFPAVLSSTTSLSFLEDNDSGLLFIARPTAITLVAHFVLLVVGLFGLLKLAEAMIDFIKGNKNSKSKESTL